MFRITALQKYFASGARLTVLFLMLRPEAVSGKNYEIELKSNYSREVLNYEGDTADSVLRGSTNIMLGDTFNFNFTTLRNLDAKTGSFTWNLSLKDISGFMDITAGNYNLHFGSGLMMGKPSYLSGDPFTKKISIAKDKTVTPSNGGNPEYSFFGTVFDFHKTFENVKTYCIPFSSIRKRFISILSSETGAIDSSLFSLNTKTEKKGNCTEPVNIINYGGVLGLQISDLFNLQTYYFETDLKSDKGRDILWDRDKFYAAAGIDLIRNAGLFAEYADRNISIFIEQAMSSIENGNTVTDFGFTGGIAIQNQIMNFSVKGKNTGRNFHSENSSGSRTPERIWETKYGIYPFNFFETGVILYSEKDLAPAYNKDYIDGSMQKELFAAVNTEYIDINLNVKRKERYSSDGNDPADQGNLSAVLTPSDRFYIKIRTSSQRSSDRVSFLYGGDMKFLFMNYMGLSLGYTRIIIHGEMPFYAVMSPSSEHSSVTGYRESSHGGTINFRYRKNGDSFYIRFTAIKTDSGFTGDAESALTLIF